MKILASVPVEKIRLSPATYTFRHEVREVDVVRVMRHPATSNRLLRRFYYEADVKPHPDMHPEAICIGLNGLYRTNIVRATLNPKWKPPEFPEGKYVVEVSE